eukprot:445729_1
MSLWECKHCGLYNYHVQEQCKACFHYKYHQTQNTIMSHTQTIQTAKKQKYEHYKYQSPLTIILKRPLIAGLTVYGYIRKQNQFYPEEMIQLIYNFYFIEILSYH